MEVASPALLEQVQHQTDARQAWLISIDSLTVQPIEVSGQVWPLPDRDGYWVFQAEDQSAFVVPTELLLIRPDWT